MSVSVSALCIKDKINRKKEKTGLLLGKMIAVKNTWSKHHTKIQRLFARSWQPGDQLERWRHIMTSYSGKVPIF